MSRGATARLDYVRVYAVSKYALKDVFVVFCLLCLSLEIFVMPSKSVSVRLAPFGLKLGAEQAAPFAREKVCLGHESISLGQVRVLDIRVV